jgi:APA family basic amino acid/polyamine antiporter
VFVLRYRKIGEESRYRTFGYPLTPLIYLSITLWTLVYILVNRPMEGLVGLGLLAAGTCVYFISRRASVAPEAGSTD